MSKQSELFAQELVKLNRAVAALGGHSRLLMMNPNRRRLIKSVLLHAGALLELSQNGQTPSLSVARQVNAALKPSESSIADELATAIADDTPLEPVDETLKPGFKESALTLTLPSDALNHPLMASGLQLSNPDEQRVTFKSSDEMVLSFADASKFSPVIRGFGDAVITATFHKKGSIAGSKHDVAISLIREAEQDGDDVELAPEGAGPLGFLRPSPDYDLELTLGTDAYIDTPFPLPIEVAKSDGGPIEFESSDETVFAVDAETGTLFPKAEGDAMLIAHIGDVKDELFVSIKS